MDSMQQAGTLVARFSTFNFAIVLSLKGVSGYVILYSRISDRKQMDGISSHALVRKVYNCYFPKASVETSRSWTGLTPEWKIAVE
jgi:hypothetical protein